jgi:murein DD-endopeptidase MepM/ murein hydrolase activator NlpD
MTNAHRDLAAPQLWIRSLERSRKRRELLPKARRENNRRKHMSAALATAVVAGPGAPLAAAQVSGDLSAAVAAESPANRAIEIREGGLPLQVGSQGELVAHVQRALHVTADGVFGPQTDAAVRSYQQSAGLEVDGIVGLQTWGSLFESQTASGASIGGSNVPSQVKERVASHVEQAGIELAAQGEVQGAPGAGTTTPDAGTTGPTAPGGTTTGDTTTSTPTPVSNGQACGSSTISSPVHGTVTSPYGPRGGRNHDGMDIAAPTGTPVRAAACGTVSLAGQQSGYGNIVCVTHTSQFSTCYAHLSRFGVSNGAQVQQGQVIGYVGCTGSCTGPHLHFETRVGGQAQNPQQYLAGASIPGQSAQKASATGTSKTGTTTATRTAAQTAPAGTATTSTGTQVVVAPSGRSSTTGTPATTEDSLAQGTTSATTTTAAPTGTATATDGTVTDTSGIDTTATAAVPVDPAATAVPAAPTTDTAVTGTTEAGTVTDETVTSSAPAAPAPAPASAPAPVPAPAPAPVEPAVTATVAPEPAAVPAAPVEPAATASVAAAPAADATVTEPTAQMDATQATAPAVGAEVEAAVPAQ